jgi:hypothetical protein
MNQTNREREISCDFMRDAFAVHSFIALLPRQAAREREREREGGREREREKNGKK